MTVLDRSEKQAEAPPGRRHRAPVRLLRKVAVAIAGVALIVAGVAMLVLPGPGILTILAGLGLLGTEFPTARRISRRINGYAVAAWRRTKAVLSRRG